MIASEDQVVYLKNNRVKNAVLKFQKWLIFKEIFQDTVLCFKPRSILKDVTLSVVIICIIYPGQWFVQLHSRFYNHFAFQGKTILWNWKKI